MCNLPPLFASIPLRKEVKAAIRAQAAQVATVMADLDVLSAHVIQDVLGVLTPAQIQKLGANGGNAAAKIDRFVSGMTRHRGKG